MDPLIAHTGAPSPSARNICPSSLQTLDYPRPTRPFSRLAPPSGLLLTAAAVTAAAAVPRQQGDRLWENRRHDMIYAPPFFSPRAFEIQEKEENPVEASAV